RYPGVGGETEFFRPVVTRIPPSDECGARLEALEFRTDVGDVRDGLLDDAASNGEAAPGEAWKLQPATCLPELFVGIAGHWPLVGGHVADVGGDGRPANHLAAGPIRPAPVVLLED